MGLTMVAIGAVHHRECVGNDATLFLIVAGGVQIFASSAKLLAYLTRIELLKKIESTGLLDLGYFAVVIWGAVKIFGKSLYSLSKCRVNNESVHILGSYPAWKANESLCPPSAFNFAFGSIIGFLIIFPLACCGFVVFAICCGRSAEESISDAA